MLIITLITMNKRKINISNNLRAFRTASGYTQKQVAGYLGFHSQDRISYWESGSNLPNLINLLKLSNLYRATVLQLYPDLNEQISDEIDSVIEKQMVKDHSNATN